VGGGRPAARWTPSRRPKGRPLVGRDDELAFLAAQWRRVRRDGQPHVVLLCGEAGSGKTRLLNELVRVADSDGTVIRATYPAYGTMGGSRVAAEVIRQLGPAHDSEVTARLRSIAGELDPSLRAIDPAGIPKEQLWALARLVQEKGAAGPLLLIIDDMHHSGDRTLELLGELAGRLNDVPMLTVLWPVAPNRVSG
jgi:predicted ATPase